MLKLSSWNLHWSSSKNVCLGWCLRCGYSFASCRATHSVSLLSWRAVYIATACRSHMKLYFCILEVCLLVLWTNSLRGVTVLSMRPFSSINMVRVILTELLLFTWPQSKCKLPILFLWCQNLMPVVISRRPEFKWGLHNSRYIYVKCGLLSITLPAYINIYIDTHTHTQ